MTDDVLLTQHEVAAILRVSVSSVKRLTSEGRLRAVHPTPGRTLYTRREVSAFVAHLEGRRVA